MSAGSKIRGPIVGWPFSDCYESAKPDQVCSVPVNDLMGASMARKIGTRLAIATASLLASGCGPSPIGLDDQKIGTQLVDGEKVSTIKIPHQEYYVGEVRLVLQLRTKDLEEGSSQYKWYIQSQNYKTGIMLPQTGEMAPDVISYSVSRVRKIDGRQLFAPWEMFEDAANAGMVNGLIYKPIPVGSRPDFLLKRGYLKPGVPASDFYIWCIPPVGPGSISPPKNCVMDIVLAKTKVKGDEYAGRISVIFSADRISDWPEIEARALEKFTGRISFEVIGE